MLSFIKIFVVLLITTNIVLGQSFSFSGPSETVINWGQTSKTVTFNFTYYNTNGLVAPHLITQIDDNDPFS